MGIWWRGLPDKGDGLPDEGDRSPGQRDGLSDEGDSSPDNGDGLPANVDHCAAEGVTANRTVGTVGTVTHIDQHIVVRDS